MDVIVQVLKTKEIGFVKFGEPDFTQLTGVALVIVAIVLISVFTMKEAQEQREHRNEMALSSESVTTTTYETPAEVPSVSSPSRGSVATSQAATPLSTKKSARARTPSRGRTPKKENAFEEEEEDDRAKTPRKRAASNRRGRQSEVSEVVASPEVTRTRGGRQAKTPKA